MNFTGARDYILDRLKNELSPNLFYHNLDHTLDVLKATTRLAGMEMLDNHSLQLLETAALYHDAGMILTYQNHEDESIHIASEALPRFGYTIEETGDVSRLIAVTRLPHEPSDLPERIICDADMDSLGREDYFIQAFRLHLEWRIFGIMDVSLTEWFRLQVKFLEKHDYFTAPAQSIRREQKAKNLLEMKALLNNN